MNANTISYKVKTADEKDIYSHLMECSDEFIPPLKERVNITEYSKKISDKAITFEAWENNKLVGLIATYTDNDTKRSFITNVSVLKTYMNLGIGGALLNMCITYCKEKKWKEIKLEVHKDNLPAINFYIKFNFLKTDTKGDIFVMNLNI